MSKRIKELENRILQARNNYYNSQPTISDEEYDALIDELKALDPNNKAITSIGAPVVSEWKKAIHKIPMGSLDKINTEEQLIELISKKWGNCSSILCTEKLDGISIECIYENGKLIQALTRGTGLEGENIVSNVIKMHGVKEKLPKNFSGSLRGEIILCRSKHKKYFSEYSNPRNAASGIAKRYDGEGCQYLDVLFYQAIGDVEFENEIKQFDYIFNDLELQTPNFIEVYDVENIMKLWNMYQERIRKNLDYDIDGLVLRINNIKVQNEMGMTNLRPKGAIAFKFAAEMRETTLKDIIWQCGPSGRISPVAIFDPINLCGATIEKASLHTVKNIQDLNLEIGCKILVSRRNDVIPYVEKRIK